MSPKASPSPKQLSEWGLAQLQLHDGCTSLASRREVAVEITLRQCLGGACIGSIHGHFTVYPSEQSPGWYLLVKATPGSINLEGR